MTLIQYRDINFRGASEKTIEQANLILAAAAADGFHSMTLRQLYYQFVSRNWIANSEKEYKRLGRIVTDARYAGLISWTAIEDAGRNSYHHRGCATPEEVLKGIEGALALDPWVLQDHYVETWVEKQALESTVARPCNALRAPYMACKGYLSASEMWRAGRRFERAIANGKQPVLLHLGDHDPSGIDMTRDSDERLAEIARMGVTVRRLALNMDQVTQYNPPPNPAKQTDSRFTGYEERFGAESWELDALPQRVIGTIITDALRQYIDPTRWDESMRREQELRKPLAKLHRRWEEISRLVDDEGLPLDRLAAMETAGLWYPMGLATNLDAAAKVVFHHDMENNAYLLQDMVEDRDMLLEAQRRLDEVAERASQLATERASDETDEQEGPSEEPDYGIDDED